MGWKYVMFERPSTGQKVPVIFPDFMVHEDVANVIRTMEGCEKLVPVSAGNVNELSIFSVSDKSTTLNLECDPEDKNIINRLQYFHGF